MSNDLGIGFVAARCLGLGSALLSGCCSAPKPLRKLMRHDANEANLSCKVYSQALLGTKYDATLNTFNISM